MDDRIWFSERIEENKTSLYRVARSVMRNDEDAKDAVAEAIMKSWQSLASLREREKFRPWILRIVSNTAYSMLRERKNEVELDNIVEFPDKKAPDVDERLTLKAAVDSLPDDFKTVVVLFYYEDFTIREICGILGVTEGAVKTRLFRARQKLKELLKEACNE